MNVKFIAHENNGLSLMGFEPMRPKIFRLLVQQVTHSAMLPLNILLAFVVMQHKKTSYSSSQNRFLIV
jgi:hypothetical protein